MTIQAAANCIRGLAMDGVQAANSGHPGMPMGTADFAALLFLKFLKHNPSNPSWPDRDRFVLSAGHGSMLIYSLLHLSGYDLPIEELKHFRQWGSRTPGHPEFGLTPGVETTTGPLGQGIANAVGMALAEAMLAERFNRDGSALVDHRTYALCGDGCMMEGISHEACSLAGHLGLHKLTLFYDSNRITIEGSTDLAYSDDARKRFEGYGWQVLEIDAHDLAACEDALSAARQETQRPTLIIGHTIIAKGAPHLAGSHETHGAPLGDDEIRAAKEALGLPEDQTFFVPHEVKERFETRRAELAKMEAAWNELRERRRETDPEGAAEFESFLNRDLPPDLEASLPSFEAGASIATRKASGQVMQSLAKVLPNFIGGSADLGPSNSTVLKDCDSVAPGSFGGRNLHFGVREHAMAAALNGMALHGGFHVFGATFLVFSDYLRPALRLSALMKLPVVYVFTHDSFLIGEDGPTHQPVEHLAALRTIPNLDILRPADAAETAVAWVYALRRTEGPTALLFTRQDVPVLDRSKVAPAEGARRGAYTLWQSAEGEPDLILIASGSEIQLALTAAETLAGEALVRVVNMVSMEVFDRQTADYREDILPPPCRARVSVEAGRSIGWERYVGPGGVNLSRETFGDSAPGEVLAEQFGFTAAHVLRAARAVLERP
jgi:transketolase